MPAVLHAPVINTPGFMLKEHTAEPLVPAFTAVNGRTSPPSPRRIYAINGMNRDTVHVRPLARNSPEPPQDPKGAPPPRDDWTSARNVAGNRTHNGPSSPATLSDEGQSSPFPGKRKRSSSAEDLPTDRSSDGSVAARQRLESDAMAASDRDDASQARARLNLKGLQARALPPMDRPDSDRTWTQSHDVPPNGHRDHQHHDHQHDDARRSDRHDDHSSHPSSLSQFNAMEDHNDFDHPGATEMTRAGVQVDPKKRKRQFANRTKTGCGTCRRRKKKCDEAKPECNNCSRGGFICEGYANKVPWPKNGVQKPHPPLQARDHYPHDSAQLYHSHGTSRESYPDPHGPNGTDGARARPIVVEEHDRPLARNGWGSGWSEPPRAAYPPEQHHAAEYSQPPQTPAYARPTSREQHVPPTSQPPSSRAHNPRIYHHTPQTMSQVVNNPPSGTAEAGLHHPAPPPSMAPHTVGPPAPPPPHYAPLPPPPQSQRSEKEKMLAGDWFGVFDQGLMTERDKCKGAVYRFNSTANEHVGVSLGSRDLLFRAILSARGARHERSVCGHYGENVYVDTPFTCDYGYNLSIADNVEIGTSCRLLDSGRITIGRNTTIGANVTIDTQRTPDNPKDLKGRNRKAMAAEVHIGENVHIGANCTILAGVSIGNGAIIRPGSVVNGNIPSERVARGNPATID